MYARKLSIASFITLFALAGAATASFAQQPKAADSAVAHPAPAPNAVLRGRVADPSEAVIPGAAISVLDQNGKTLKTATSDATGNFLISGLLPGSYTVQVTSPGFAPFVSEPLTIAAGQAKRLDVAMAVEAEQQVVTVTDDASVFVNVDAGSNASAIVLKDKALDALSDDPDELADQLNALAGPSAGPNGGQIYIDGFSDGQLPPKSSIREIRVNQNPFSAEFDKLGFARVEILTKPGTDKLHGRVFSQGNDKSFNTGNPFTPDVPGYHTFMMSGNLTGALNKNTSFNLSGDYRNIAEADVYNATTPTGTQSGAISNPHTRVNVTPRIDLQLGAKNTLTVRYQFYRDEVSGNLSSSRALPNQATGATQFSHQLQVSDSVTLSDHAVNETRVQWMHTSSDNTSVSTKPVVSVSGYFTDGGAAQQFSTTTEDSIDLQNATTMSIRSHALKFGGRLRYYNESTSSSQNFNGTFSFASNADVLTGKPNTLTFTVPASSATLYPTAPKYSVDLFDLGLYIQDDWKANRFLTLSGGLRWESQNKINDKSDWGPRVALAYALDGHKNSTQTKTVLRAGYGFFYDRFSLANSLKTITQSGGADSLKQYVISNPTCYNATSLSSISTSLSGLLSACGAGTTSTSTTVQVSPTYKSPLTQQLSVSVERQLTKSTSLSLTYLRSFGTHQLVTINANPIDPATLTYVNGTATGTRLNYAKYGSNIVNEYLPEGVFKQNQLIASINARFSKNFNLTGFYSLNYANTNANTSASNSLNLNQDYGRSSSSPRHSLMTMFTYKGPWGISFNPFIIAQSGKPYNITVNKDLTGDNFKNNRPAWADASACTGSTNTGRYVQTTFGCFDVQPAAGYTPIPINLGKGPAYFVTNLRMNRAFGIGPKLNAGGNAQSQGGGDAPPPGAGAPPAGGGAPGGGAPPGAGGWHGSSASTGRKYSLTFIVEANNIFNNVNYGTPSGSIAPVLLDSTTHLYGPGSQFGASTSLASTGRGQASSSAVRRITFQAAFSF